MARKAAIDFIGAGATEELALAKPGKIG